MSRRRAPLLASQDGYTVLEMIITMALTAIVSGAIFSSFLVLDRIQTAWEQRDQARAVGVLAEQPLLRDVQAYHVASAPSSILVLQGLSTQRGPSPQPTFFTVTYSVRPSPRGGSVLNRSVTQGALTLSTATVAHGVQSFSAVCQAHTTLTVTMRLDAISIRSIPQPVTVSPVLTLTPRNGC